MGPARMGCTRTKGSSLISSDSLTWRRSQRCDNATCVEVARTIAGVAMRDSTHPDGPVLRFPATAWDQLMADLRAGRHHTR